MVDPPKSSVTEMLTLAAEKRAVRWKSLGTRTPVDMERRSLSLLNVSTISFQLRWDTPGLMRSGFSILFSRIDYRFRARCSFVHPNKSPPIRSNSREFFQGEEEKKTLKIPRPNQSRKRIVSALQFFVIFGVERLIKSSSSWSMMRDVVNLVRFPWVGAQTARPEVLAVQVGERESLDKTIVCC